ncbi:MAG: hypothetical protein K6G30_13555 [Acetatifactor sp.]|nr:hypothetical protein [Acetatifactor sp.]
MVEILSSDDLLLINGGGVKEVVCTGVGVCGGVVGAAAGFVGGFSVTTGSTLGFATPAGVVVGIGTGAVGARLGYAGAKSAAESAWDFIADAIS